MPKWTVSFICLNVEAEDQEGAFEAAFEQVTQDDCNILQVSLQGGTWDWEMEPG